MEVICQFMSLLVEHFDWNVVPTTPQVFCMCPILNNRPVLCFWTMDTLDPCSDGDINNDVSSLYVQIIEKNFSFFN